MLLVQYVITYLFTPGAIISHDDDVRNLPYIRTTLLTPNKELNESSSFVC